MDEESSDDDVVILSARTTSNYLLKMHIIEMTFFFVIACKGKYFAVNLMSKPDFCICISGLYYNEVCISACIY